MPGRATPGGCSRAKGNGRLGQGDVSLTSGKDVDEAPSQGRGRGTAAHSKNRDMGAALRSVYQKTVEEAVPEDLLSLLGKLD